MVMWGMVYHWFTHKKSLFDISWIGDFFVHLPLRMELFLAQDSDVHKRIFGFQVHRWEFHWGSWYLEFGGLYRVDWVGIEYHRIYKDRVRIWNSAKYS